MRKQPEDFVMLKLITPCGMYTGSTVEEILEKMPEHKFGISEWDIRKAFKYGNVVDYAS